MQKQRSRTSKGWAGTALKCGAVALAAGLLSATAATSALADDSATAAEAPQAAAQTATQGTAAPSTETAEPAVQDASTQDAALQETAPDALAAVPGKVTAKSGLFVHDQARLTSAHVGTLSYGASVSVWCAVTTDIRWYRVQVSPQRWAAAEYISVPAGSKIPGCTSLGLSDGQGDDDSSLPMGGSGADYSSYSGDSSSIGPIIVTNQLDNAGTTSAH
jgi:hypothetical protein